MSGQRGKSEQSEERIKRVLLLLVTRIGEQMRARADEMAETVDDPRLVDLRRAIASEDFIVQAFMNAAIQDVLMSPLKAMTTPGTLSRGEVQAFFSTLWKILAPDDRSDIVGTQKLLDEEFFFEGFTPRGTPAFRHRQTNRVLYVVVEPDGGEIRIGMYDDRFLVFRHHKDALKWVRATKPGMPAMISNMLWLAP
jgi:hypothetical protein